MPVSRTSTPSSLDRRAVLKGAAWAVPVIAAAIAVPVASASTNDNTTTDNGTTNKLPNRPTVKSADYRWATAAGSALALSASAKKDRGTLSMHAVYGGTTAPAGATFQYTVTFNRDVTIIGSDYQPWLHTSPGRGRVFSFTLPAAMAHDIFFNFKVWEPGALTATGAMSLINGGSTTVESPISATAAL